MFDIGNNDTEKYNGLYRARVYATSDIDKSGAIMVELDALFDRPVKALPCFAYAGENYGLYSLPPVGSGVWIMFEGCDPEHPVWVGGWYADGESPSEMPYTDTTPRGTVLKSPTGHSIVLNDKNESVSVIASNGDLVSLTSNGISIVSEKVYIGSQDSATYKAVLGEKLIEALGNFVDRLGTVAGIQTPGGPTAPISTSPQWGLLVLQSKQEFEQIVSNVLKIND